MTVEAIWHRSENGHVVVLIKVNGDWIEIFREYSSACFSEIIGTNGLLNAVRMNNEPASIHSGV